jgi:hypothetical protein
VFCMAKSSSNSSRSADFELLALLAVFRNESNSGSRPSSVF